MNRDIDVSSMKIDLYSDKSVREFNAEAAPDEPSPEPTIEAPTRRPKAAPETDEVEQIIKEYNK